MDFIDDFVPQTPANGRPRAGRSQQQRGVSHNYEGTQHTMRRSGESSCADSDKGQSSNGGESGNEARPGQDEDGANSDDGGGIDSDESPISHTHSFNKGFRVNNGKKAKKVGMGKLKQPSNNVERVETGNMSQTTCDMLVGAGYATAAWWNLGVTMIAISYVNRKGE